MAFLHPVRSIKVIDLCVSKHSIMERKKFTTTINAPREKVWEVLWGDETYRKWTSVFAEGSRAETDWKEGSKVLFTDGKGEGMVSMIAKKKPDEFMSFKHLGVLKNGVEDTQSDAIKDWAGAMENYTLTPVDGKTELIVELDMNDEFKDYFTQTFPKALDKVKELSEN
jgi:hypothetical protein